MNTTLIWLPAPLPASTAKHDKMSKWNFKTIQLLHEHHPPLASCSATSLNRKTTSSSKILND
jgi:hypothetical protein